MVIPSFSTAFTHLHIFGEANVAARLAEGLVGVVKHRFLIVSSIIALVRWRRLDFLSVTFT